jgi:glycogen phosphorylase
MANVSAALPVVSKSTKSKGPTVASRIRAIAMNLWWSWSPDAQRLFASLDPQLWTATRNNPLRTLKLLSPERLALIESDPAFAKHVDVVEKLLADYMKASPWFAKKVKKGAGKTIAYFCAEYAVHESMQQYSGGLGVLAGDHLKSASDLGLPLVGIGMLYRCGYYTQEFDAKDGSTRVIYPTLDFADLPITDTGKTGVVQIGDQHVTFRIWKQQVGRVALYLMDTDVEPNTPDDRALTRHLYGGDREYRIRQEMLLGVGGLIMLDKLGIKPDVCHLNEGHAAFCALERVTRIEKSGHTATEAIKAVRHSTVFTTHTPVPAGNDRFSPTLTMKYLSRYAKALKVDADQLLALGREDEHDAKEEFCMTVLALKLAEHCNGVAALHGDTSRKMWTKVYGGIDDKHVPIGHVTNGIHPPTWLAPEMMPLYAKHLKPNFVTPEPGQNPWANATKIPDAELWHYRNLMRAKLIHFVRQRLLEQIARGHGPIEAYQHAYETFDADTLTIGFARRFATYKRAPLVFHDAKRLAKILGHKDRPVQIVFAGKAHPADTGGQDFAAKIFKHAKEASFTGRVVILEDYDMAMGRALTSGADVWLNNPLRPQEASGTSGMKPPLHGGLNCSILDGWWPEAWDGDNGWAIGGKEFADQKKQDAFDANSIYTLIEKQIAPAFYKRDKSGVPKAWVKMMKSSLTSVCAQFSTTRMVAEYWTKYYSKAAGVK